MKTDLPPQPSNSDTRGACSLVQGKTHWLMPLALASCRAQEEKERDGKLSSEKLIWWLGRVFRGMPLPPPEDPRQPVEINLHPPLVIRWGGRCHPF